MSGPLESRVRWGWLAGAVIAGATLLVWAHTVTYDFVWDDQQCIQDLSSIRSLENVPSMFYSLAAQSSYPAGFRFFRPLRTVQYAILYWLEGGRGGAPQPWLFHLTNVVWHGVAAILLCLVARVLFTWQLGEARGGEASGYALLIGTAFATHPVVSEVVCWAKSLDDAMAAVFVLAAAWCLLRWGGERRRYGWSLLWFLLAVYSKVSAVPFVGMAWLIFRCVHRVSPRRSLKLTAGFVAVAALFLVHRAWVIGRVSQTAPISGSYGRTLVDMLPVVPEYARLLCGVPPFHIDYSFLRVHESLMAAPVVAGAALLALAVGGVIWAARRPGWRLAALGGMWLGLFLLPVSNLVPMMQYMAERFLYLPLIGWLIAAGACLARYVRPRVAAVCGVLVVATWMGLAWQRSWIWRDGLTLFVQSSLEGPPTPRVENNAVSAIFDLPQLRAVFRLDPNNPRYRLAAAGRIPHPATVIRTLREAHRLFPANERVALGLGVVYAKTGRLPQAIALFEAVTRRWPTGTVAWVDLGQAWGDAGRWAKARPALERALALDPGNLQVLRALAACCWHQQDYSRALAVLDRLRALAQENVEDAALRRRIDAARDRY